MLCVYNSLFLNCLCTIFENIFAGVTILLSLTVFLNMVAETMPATSDAVPLLGKYLLHPNYKLFLLIRKNVVHITLQNLFLYIKKST